jgi:teichuronopeptide biosynthesis TupA-like protein
VVAPKHAVYRLIGLNAHAERKLDLYLSRRAYRRAHGRYPDLDHPVLFTEKALARKLFEERPIFCKLSDKLHAREFVAERVGGQYLPGLYGVYRRFDDIDFGRLPDRFVIKTNHGSKFVLIADGTKPFDRAGARKLVERWMRTNYYDGSREKFYRNVARKIMVEELLTERAGAPAVDYRFYVYDGAAKFFYVSYRPEASGAEAKLLAESDGRALAFFDRTCRWFPVRQTLPGMPPASPQYFETLDQRWQFPIPDNIEEMLELAGKIGQGFDFVRIDMYNPGGRVLFGEFTTIPGGGIIPFDPPSYDRFFGEPWALKLA